MGRELRRKQAKKEGKSLKKEITTETHQIKNLIIITIILLIIIGLIYLLSALFVTKELDWFEKDTEETNTLVDKTILASEIFNQSGEEYYVYFYDYKDEDSEVTSAVNQIKDLTVYKVDTGSALNNNYVSKESNKLATNLSELKVKSPTVIKISGDNIKEYYEGDEITNKLGK